MSSCSALLVALLAAAAAAATTAQGTPSRSFYSKVASCVAQELKKEVVSEAATAVGIATTGAKPAQDTIDSVDYYTVGFAPGIGCLLMSTITNVDLDLGEFYSAGAIVATSPAATRVTTNSYTCRFTKASAAFSPTQARNLARFSPLIADNNLDAADATAAFQLPQQLSSLKDKLRCSYVLYSKTGYNYFDGKTCSTKGDPDSCKPAAPFDVPNIQWHFDKDNAPKINNATSDAISVTCTVNKALLNNDDTMLAQRPNDGSCFPASARVITPEGPKRIAQLAVGDKVLAVDASTGQAVFDDVYLMPHRDASAAAAYLNIRATPVAAEGSSNVLTLSPMHYIPIACGGAGQQQQCLKHAREVAAGDLVWLLQGQAAELARVDEVTASIEQGMYSPWTLSGSIVVEGFAASTHTAWPGEAQLLQLLPRKHAVAAQHAFAQAHHTVQTPLRAAYRALGKGPLALLDNVIFAAMQAAAAPSGRVAVAVGAAARVTTAA